MKAYLKNYMEEYRLNYENGIIYGSMHGYQISSKTDTLERVYSFRSFVFTKLTEEDNQKILEFLTSMKTKLKLVKFEVKDSGIFF